MKPTDGLSTERGKSPGGGDYLNALMELDDNTGQLVQAIHDLGTLESVTVELK